MNNKTIVTRVLAIAGTMLVWIPILFMIVTSVVGSIASGRFLCDFLIPAELFMVELVGAVLLFWAAYRSRVCLKAVGWNCGALILLLFGGMMIAQVSGLASGAAEPKGILFIITIGAFILYTASVVLLGIAGIALVRGLLANKGKQE